LLDNFVDLRLLGEIVVFQFFETSVTIVTLLVASIVFYIFITVAWILQNVLYHTLPRSTAADPGVVYSVSTISRYTIIALGIIFSLQSLGLDLSTLTVIGGGLSIGIGIGLQRIVANFISGIILLFEQSLRPGDVIDINGEIGTVEQLNIRATVVRTRNNVEVIVPNEIFVTTQVKTYTKSTRETRILLPIGVSYNEDPKEVRRVVLETAVRHGLILKEPEPALLFRGFGDSSLNFDLAVWIDQPQHTMRVRSDLYYMIFETLKSHGIVIPFPQRDLHLKLSDQS
jgi:small-conductance mechanosensitive channel